MDAAEYSKGVKSEAWGVYLDSSGVFVGLFFWLFYWFSRVFLGFLKVF